VASALRRNGETISHKSLPIFTRLRRREMFHEVEILWFTQHLGRTQSKEFRLQNTQKAGDVENAMRSIQALRWKMYQDDATILKSSRKPFEIQQ